MSHSFSIQVAEAIAAITGANAIGELTIASNTVFYPGAFAWVTKNDGSLQARVLIVRRVSTTKVQVRKVASGLEQNVPAPTYGFSDMSGFNTTSTLCQEAQTAPVVSDFQPRQIS